MQDKGFLTKVLVFGGGVFMNYITAIVTITLVLLIGYKVDLFPTKVEVVEPATSLAASGIKPGDQVVAVNGQPVKYTEDLELLLVQEIDKAPSERDKKPAAQAKVPLNLTVERGGNKQDIALAPMSREELTTFTASMFKSFWAPPYVAGVVTNSEADKAGLKKGDMIVAIDGKPVDSFRQTAKVINDSLGKQLALQVRRDDKVLSLTATPAPGLVAMNQDPKMGYLGFSPGTPDKREERVANPFKALVRAQGQAYDRMQQIILMNYKFFKHASMSDIQHNVTGPIGIAVITAKMAQMGLAELVNWFILLNLLLMIFNLLPLPVLDGGFILLAVIEGIIRRPVPPKVLGPIYTVFMIGLLCLIVLISVQDLFTWIPHLLR